MQQFWNSTLEPLLRAARPRTVLQVGGRDDRLARLILAAAPEIDCTLHSVETADEFDAGGLEAEFDGRFVHHAGAAADAIAQAEPSLILLYGDRSWYQVATHLQAAVTGARSNGARPPIIAVRDVDWPYGRRDAYPLPELVPESERQPSARGGVAPGRDELVADGLNPDTLHATQEGGPRNGVRTAVEDFLASESDWTSWEVPGNSGLVLLVAAERLAEEGRVHDVLLHTTTAEFLAQRCAEIEQERLASEMRIARLRRELAEAEQRLAQAAEARAETVAPSAMAESQARIAQGERELAATQLEVERLREELADAEGHRRRVEQDLSESRVALERDVEAAQQDALAARQELAAAHEAINRERAALDAAADGQRETRLEIATARADLEIAAAERDALRVQIGRLAEELAQSRIELERRSLDVDRVERALSLGEAERARLREELARLRQSTAGVELDEARRLAEDERRRRDDLEAELERLRRQATALELERDALIMRTAELEATGPVEALPDAETPSPNGDHPVDDTLDPDSREYAERRNFLHSYLRTVGWTRRPLNGSDPLALPGAIDRRGILVDRDRPPDPDAPSIDVVVCVHNALDDVRMCVWSLLQKTDLPFHLILVNDGSDEATTTYLKAVEAANAGVTLIHNADPPHGYTIAANLGMRAATADYVVLLNSDTIVTFGWLQRIVECGESDPSIGILGPLSNAASHQSVPRLREEGAWATNPLPPWLTPDGMAAIVAHVSPRTRPRLPFINGFCYVIKRRVFDAIGFFDEEHFASGYSEENDFSYRAGKAGFELAVVDDGYVYHAKSKSFTVEGRAVHAKRNYQIFLDKHDRAEIEEMVKGMEANTALAPMRASVGDAAASPAGTAAALRTDDVPLTVVFVLPGLGEGGSGGSHSIYQEVRGLRQLGVNARIALAARAMPRAQAAYDDAAEVFQPFEDPEDLAVKTIDADVISATHFKSARIVADLVERRGDFLPAYYIQDYEPLFALAAESDIEEAVSSYTEIPGVLLFAKTHWLCNVVSSVHGVHVAKVEPSIDEQLFAPALRRRADGPVRVAAMVRPRTPRRQPFGTVNLLERLQRELPDDVEIMTFGCRDDELLNITTSPLIHERHLGLLKRHRVAGLLSSIDVFLDLSMYQAFGRTALEAMACGATAVAPRLGGIWEFARDQENLVAVDTLDEEASYAALRDLVVDRDRLRAMQGEALATAGRYSILRAALSEYTLFTQEHARRFGRDHRNARAGR